MSDTRNSKVADFIHELKEHGYQVAICEPHVSGDLFGCKNVALDQVKNYDFVIKAVRHQIFKDLRHDYEIIYN